MSTRKEKQQRVTRFCFTLNNYTDDELDSLKTLPHVRWMIIGKEVAPVTGTPHLQGAVALQKQMTFPRLKELPGLVRAHMEIMKGTLEDSKVYCSKEDPSPFIRGTLPSPGKRNDLLSVTQMIDQGVTMRQVAMAFPSQYVKYTRGLTSYRGMVLEGRKDKPTVVWIYGASGSGKTRCAVELASVYGSYWISPGSLKWFDGYTGEDVAILDDIREDHCAFAFLLRLLDRYPFSVEVKGSFVNWIPSIIIVTCPASPTGLFAGSGSADILQLTRRIDHILEFPRENKPYALFDLLGVAHSKSIPLNKTLPLEDKGKEADDGGEASFESDDEF